MKNHSNINNKKELRSVVSLYTNGNLLNIMKRDTFTMATKV